MRDHGTRACYVFGPEPGSDRSKGCRCEPCKAANRAYALARHRAAARPDESLEPAYVDNAEAREHLAWLASVGVGKRAVHERSGVALSAIDKIRSGKVTRSRPDTIAAILAVGRSAARGGALVDAKDTWRRIDDLCRHGWTKARISAAIGNNGRTLQVGRRRVTAATADKVRRLHETALLPVLLDRQAAAEKRAMYRRRQAEQMEQVAS